MSWFSDLTSKAEAMLVKLDRDAAQALQNPDGLLRGKKILDQALTGIMTEKVDSFDDPLITQDDPPTSSDQNAEGYNDSFDQCTEQNRSVSDNDIASEPISTQNIGTVEPRNNLNDLIEIPNGGDQSITATTPTESVDTTRSNPSRYSSKFSIRAGRSGTQSFAKQRQGPYSITDKSNQDTSPRDDPKPIPQPNKPAAADIRASINRSIQEYADQSFSRNDLWTDSRHRVSHASHFDDQPNLIQYSSSLAHQDRYDAGRKSHSFSIDVPENQSSSQQSTSVAAQLLQQCASKKKSTFYLHKVINKIANPNGQSEPLIGDQMRIKLRRAQMRASSYARRLNYYFRTYPMMKYWMMFYLFLMQILVIYVLFFYQSSSSTTDLSSQIKHQQQELGERNLNRPQ